MEDIFGYSTKAGKFCGRIYRQIARKLLSQGRRDSRYSVPIGNLEKHVYYMPSSKLATVSSLSVEKQKRSNSKPAERAHTNSVKEMRRILSSRDHYETLGFKRFTYIDATLLRKEYLKQAKLVHPDKNRGNSLATKSFQKLRLAYEVLSDCSRKRDYDDQLRKNDPSKSTNQSSCNASHQGGLEQYWPVKCKNCGIFHRLYSTTKIKATARWCKTCSDYHEAKEGDGWAEYKVGSGIDQPRKVEIPRIFVCFKGMIFEVSDWVMCQTLQEMDITANTHWPSFHLNKDMTVDLTKEQKRKTQWIKESLNSGGLCKSSSGGRKPNVYNLQNIYLSRDGKKELHSEWFHATEGSKKSSCISHKTF